MKFSSLKVIKNLVGHGPRWPAVVDHAWSRVELDEGPQAVLLKLKNAVIL